MAKIGDVRVSRADEYERIGEWVVEEYGHVNFDTNPSWYVPGWVEDRFGESGFFKTKEQAIAFLDVVLA